MYKLCHRQRRSVPIFRDWRWSLAINLCRLQTPMAKTIGRSILQWPDVLFWTVLRKVYTAQSGANHLVIICMFSWLTIWYRCVEQWWMFTVAANLRLKKFPTSKGYTIWNHFYNLFVYLVRSVIDVCVNQWMWHSKLLWCFVMYTDEISVAPGAFCMHIKSPTTDCGVDTCKEGWDLEFLSSGWTWAWLWPIRHQSWAWF